MTRGRKQHGDTLTAPAETLAAKESTAVVPKRKYVRKLRDRAVSLGAVSSRLRGARKPTDLSDSVIDLASSDEEDEGDEIPQPETKKTRHTELSEPTSAENPADSTTEPVERTDDVVHGEECESTDTAPEIQETQQSTDPPETVAQVSLWTNEENQAVRPPRKRFQWAEDDAWHLVPRNWEFPLVTSRDVWSQWFHGNDLIDPLRHIPPEDLSSDLTIDRHGVAHRLVDFLLATMDLSAEEIAAKSRQVSLSHFDRAFNHVVIHRLNQNPHEFAKKTFVDVCELFLKSPQVFSWPDRTWRRVPSSWSFPDFTCPNLWLLWFRKDSGQQHDVCPYRILRNYDMPYPTVLNDLSRRRVVMETLEFIALEWLGVSATDLAAMPIKECLTIFEQTFQRFLERSRRRTLNQDIDKLCSYPFSRLYYSLIVMEPSTMEIFTRNDALQDNRCWRSLNQLTVRGLWTYWYLGNDTKQLVPLRKFVYCTLELPSEHLHHVNAAKKLIAALAEVVKMNFALSDEATAALPSAAFDAILLKACAILSTQYPVLIKTRSPSAIADTFFWTIVNEMTHVQVTTVHVPLPRPPRDSSIPTTNMGTSNTLKLHVWKNGAHRRVPQNWRFPPDTTSCATMWVYWFHGDSWNRICPFRLLSSRDFPTPDDETKWKQLGQLIETLLKTAKGLTADTISGFPISNSLLAFRKVLAINDVAAIHSDHMPYVSVLALLSSGQNFAASFASLVLHLWADGTRHIAPEKWMFPNLPCRAMWKCWFCGNDMIQIGPFRLLTAVDLVSPASKTHWTAAKTTMGFFILVAVKIKAVMSNEALFSATSSVKLIEVFDQVASALAKGALGNVKVANELVTDMFSRMSASEDPLGLLQPPAQTSKSTTAKPTAVVTSETTESDDSSPGKG
ncbi:hypothetical protein LEN26_018442 [Aphanomyces euteiches]|nr:hypothetical protein LEN26_018442 [Aphanomyces euteiches]KAH9126177.1 hypothetical protein AeMF1_003364 [Aphanomyces euteiches]KAH9189931.1 hypothetical protein AeNC1_008090 [Aphanomyces euteiches]